VTLIAAATVGFRHVQHTAHHCYATVVGCQGVARGVVSRSGACRAPNWGLADLDGPAWLPMTPASFAIPLEVAGKVAAAEHALLLEKAREVVATLRAAK
jgi:hypothetical protein